MNLSILNFVSDMIKTDGKHPLVVEISYGKCKFELCIPGRDERTGLMVLPSSWDDWEY